MENRLAVTFRARAREAPKVHTRARGTVTIDANGVRAEAQYQSNVGRTVVAVDEDGTTVDSRMGQSIPGAVTGRVGGHAAVTFTVDVSSPPATPPGELDRDHDGTPDRSDRTIGRDSDEDGVTDDVDQKPGAVDVDVDHDGVADQFDRDIAEPEAAPQPAPDTNGDGFTDGSIAESPEVGGRQGMNPAGTARSDLDTDMDGTRDSSDRTIGPDSDEDGVGDDLDAKPGEVDVDADTDGVADQFDGDVSTAAPDSDGDGNTDGSFAESPELGGRRDDGYGSSSDTGPSDTEPSEDSGMSDPGAGDARGGMLA